MPTLIASDIVGVQSMTSQMGHIFTLKNIFEKVQIIFKSCLTTSEFPYRIEVEITSSNFLSGMLSEQCLWAEEQFNDNVKCFYDNNIDKYAFDFKEEKYRTLFLLKWGV